MPKLHRNAKLERIAERELKTLMVKVNAGLATTAHLIHPSRYLLNQVSSLKVLVMRSKRHAEQVLTRMNTAQPSVNIVPVAVSAQISKCVGILFARLAVTLSSNHRPSAQSVQPAPSLMISALSTLTCAKIVYPSSTVQTLA